MKHPAYYQLLEISEVLKGTGYERELISERYIDNQLVREKTGYTSSSSKTPFTQFTLDWIPELSNPAALFILRNIMHGLKLYNLLWYWPSARKSSEKAILKELIDHQVIFRTESTGIYLVNPLKIWRGTKHSAVEATKELLRKHGKPSIELIKDLKPSGQYQLLTGADQMYLMENPRVNG